MGFGFWMVFVLNAIFLAINSVFVIRNTKNGWALGGAMANTGALIVMLAALVVEAVK